MNVFVSQPMNEKTEDEILLNMSRVKLRLKDILGEEVTVIDNYHHAAVPEGCGSIWYLGEAIKSLDKADLVVFIKGYDKAKECAVELKACNSYKIPYLHESFLFENSYLNDLEKKEKIHRVIKKGDRIR